jgi:hypothetical protein
MQELANKGPNVLNNDQFNKALMTPLVPISFNLNRSRSSGRYNSTLSIHPEIIGCYNILCYLFTRSHSCIFHVK